MNKGHVPSNLIFENHNSQTKNMKYQKKYCKKTLNENTCAFCQLQDQLSWSQAQMSSVAEKGMIW